VTSPAKSAAAPAAPPRSYWDRETIGSPGPANPRGAGFIEHLSHAEAAPYRQKPVGLVKNTRFGDVVVYYSDRLNDLVVVLAAQTNCALHRNNSLEMFWYRSPEARRVAEGYGLRYDADQEIYQTADNKRIFTIDEATPSEGSPMQQVPTHLHSEVYQNFLFAQISASFSSLFGSAYNPETDLAEFNSRKARKGTADAFGWLEQQLVHLQHENSYDDKELEMAMIMELRNNFAGGGSSKIWQLLPWEYAKNAGASANEYIALQEYSSDPGSYVAVKNSNWYLGMHHKAVHAAVKAGEDVPERVRRVYPDLFSAPVPSGEDQEIGFSDDPLVEFMRYLRSYLAGEYIHLYIVTQNNAPRLEDRFEGFGLKRLILTQSTSLPADLYRYGVLVMDSPVTVRELTTLGLEQFLSAERFPEGTLFRRTVETSTVPQEVSLSITEIKPYQVTVSVDLGNNRTSSHTYLANDFLRQIASGELRRITPEAPRTPSNRLPGLDENVRSNPQPPVPVPAGIPAPPPVADPAPSQQSEDQLRQLLEEARRIAAQRGQLPSGEQQLQTPAPTSGYEAEAQRRQQEAEQRAAAAIAAGNSRIVYEPLSKSPSFNTVIPAAMAYETQRALRLVQREFGNIDEFVRTRLRYKNLKEMFKIFSGEQVDALALAIANVERRECIVIGDMTGIGKGRIAAGMIRYACNRGMQPVFVTEKATLFSDLYRDLLAIGSAELVPFIFNTGTEANMTDEDGVLMYRAEFAGKDQILDTGVLPPSFHYAVTTYSQFSSEKKLAKRHLLTNLCQDSLVVMDESHNAGGEESNIGGFMRERVRSAQGVVFLSATFAKRPENMPIYGIKSVMREANMSDDQLIYAIKDGGTALQEIVAANLVEAGQMIRRERTFDGIVVEYKTLDHLREEHKGTADRVTEIIREIIAFQNEFVTPFVRGIDNGLKGEGGGAGVRKGTSNAGADNYPFVSKVFNIVDQLLFSIKAEAIAKEALDILKAGEKPVIAFKSTMGSFLEQMGYETGDYVENLDFALTFEKALAGVMVFSQRNTKGKVKKVEIKPSDLGPEGMAEYNRLFLKIQNVSSGITISPIDVIIQRIESTKKPGTNKYYKCAEVTGRSRKIVFDSTNSGTVQTRTGKNKKKALLDFNNGDADVLLLNASGSTGTSAHSSHEFKDQRPRTMVIHQVEVNVNTEVQKRGRINRTGQVNLPKYRYVTSAIPAEARLLMMLKRKMKSLDANTTSNQKSSDNQLEVEDFLNKYGDKVVIDYLREHAQHEMLDAMGLWDHLFGEDEEGKKKKSKEDFANKALGRVAILKSEDQERFYREVSDRYRQYVQQLRDNDQYDLEAEFLNLEVKTLTRREVVVGKGGRSAFGDSSYLEKCAVNILRKPMTRAEMGEQLGEALGSDTPQQVTRRLRQEYAEFYDKHVSKTESFIRAMVKDPDRLQIQLSEFRAEMADTKSRLENAFNTFTIGNIYKVPTADEGDAATASLAIFAGFDVLKSRENPYAPSAVTARFIVADSRRMVKIPLSQHARLMAVVGSSQSITPYEYQNTKPNWDALVTNKSRGIRFLVTNNILQGLVWQKGKLISYSTRDGEIRKGILLPESYSPKDVKSRLPISKAYDTIMALGINKVLSTVDKEVTFANKGVAFEFRTWKSTGRGGIYFTNAEILSLVDNGTFNQKGQEMVAVLQKSRLQALLDILENVFRLSVDGEALEEEDLREESKPREEEVVVFHAYEMMVNTYQSGKYPPAGLVRHEDRGNHNGFLIYNRELSPRERTNYGLKPSFASIDEPFERWMRGLTEAEKSGLREKVRQIMQTAKDATDAERKLAGYIIDTNNEPGNPEYTFGEFTFAQIGYRLVTQFKEYDKYNFEKKLAVSKPREEQENPNLRQLKMLNKQLDIALS
jgi:hypothetical protein